MISFCVTHNPQWTTRWFCVLLWWSWLNSKQWRSWIIVSSLHLFSAKLTTVIFWKNDYVNENIHCCFLILYYNTFPKLCDHNQKMTVVNESLLMKIKKYAVVHVTPALDTLLSHLGYQRPSLTDAAAPSCDHQIYKW